MFYLVRTATGKVEYQDRNISELEAWRAHLCSVENIDWDTRSEHFTITDTKPKE